MIVILTTCRPAIAVIDVSPDVIEAFLHAVSVIESTRHASTLTDPDSQHTVMTMSKSFRGSSITLKLRTMI